MKRFIAIITLVIFVTLQGVAFAKLETISQDPYISALSIDADTGDVLFEKNADVVVYPASVLKLMTLLVTLDRVQEGQIRLTDMVQITPEAARMGGSQVYLDPKEQFSVEDLLFALMVQSANDAAVALAIHVAGSVDGFVKLMNQKAQELGMKNTKFHSAHGLPPGKDQDVDVTTANDLARLCLALVENPQTFIFTSATERDFRDGQFIMRTHNHLLENVSGCDGLKTGYFRAAGFSIAATAKRNGKRVIAIVLGSKDRKVRDAKARELIENGFRQLPTRPTKQESSPQQAVNTTQPQAQNGAAVQILETSSTSQPEQGEIFVTPAVVEQVSSNFHLFSFLYGFGAGFVTLLLLLIFLRRKKRSPYRYSR